MPTPADLAVDALATYRLTRLAVADVITEPPRRAAVQWAFHRAGLEPLTIDPGSTVVEALAWYDAQGHDIPKLATLATCPWCVGVYVAPVVVALRALCPRVWGPVARALAASAVTGLLAVHEQ